MTSVATTLASVNSINETIKLLFTYTRAQLANVIRAARSTKRITPASMRIASIPLSASTIDMRDEIIDAQKVKRVAIIKAALVTPFNFLDTTPDLLRVEEVRQQQVLRNHSATIPKTPAALNAPAPITITTLEKILAQTNEAIKEGTFDYKNIDKGRKSVGGFVYKSLNRKDELPEKQFHLSRDEYITGELINIQLEKMPRVYPYYVQTSIRFDYDKRPNESGDIDDVNRKTSTSAYKLVYEPRAVKIATVNDRSQYAGGILDRIFHSTKHPSYLGASGPVDTFAKYPIRDFVTKIYTKDLEQRGTIAVARYQAGNCLLNIIHNAGRLQPAVFKKFPHLIAPTSSKGMTASPLLVYINHNEIETVARLCALNITVYSALGAKIHQTWHRFGAAKAKKIEVIFSEGHATLAVGKIKPTRIVYEDFSKARETTIADYTDATIHRKPSQSTHPTTQSTPATTYPPAIITRESIATSDIIDAFLDDSAASLPPSLLSLTPITPSLSPVHATNIADVFAANVIDRAFRKIASEYIADGISTERALTYYTTIAASSPLSPRSGRPRKETVADSKDDLAPLLPNAIEFTLHKEFRPSSVTKNIDDDSDLKLANVHSADQMLLRIFKQKFNLERPTDGRMVDGRPLITDIIKSAEHFISRRSFIDLSADGDFCTFGGWKSLRECDNIKNYCSYTANRYYVGFPGNMIVPCSYSEDKLRQDKYSHVVCKNIVNAPAGFRHLIRYTGAAPGEISPITLTAPVCKYLLDHGATIDVNYAMAASMKMIDIIAFGQECVAERGIDESTIKKFRNSLIGRTIAGGIAETRSITVQCDAAEMHQLVQECIDNDLAYSAIELNPPNLVGFGANARLISHEVTCDYKNDCSGLFHFHSFILGYALINMMDQWAALEEMSCEIVAYNVDAIIYKPLAGVSASEVASYLDTHIGGWVTKPPGRHYQRLMPSVVAMRDIVYGSRDGATSLADDPHIVHNNTILTREVAVQCENPIIYSTLPYPHRFYRGAAGVGKSYMHKKNSGHMSIFLTPTRQLRDEHINDSVAPFANTVTVEKYFRLQLSFDQWFMQRSRHNTTYPRGYLHIYIDEAYMFTRDDWTEILKRAAIDNAVIIALGDPCQIANSIDSEPVTEQWFADNGFEMIDVSRLRDVPARHSYDYGCGLDKLRGLSYEEQSEYLSSPETSMHVSQEHMPVYENPPPTSSPSMCARVICGSWAAVAKYHEAVRSLLGAASVGGGFSYTLSILCKSVGRQRRVGRSLCGELASSLTLVPVDSPTIWWGRKRMSDVAPADKCEPAYATTVDSFQGTTAACKLYIDVGSLDRDGALYTAVTRTRDACDTVLVYEPDVFERETGGVME